MGADPKQSTWFGHPKGLAVLFLTAAWEQFSFFGMRVLLVYYMTKGLLMAQGHASLVYGMYTALVYLTPIAGGWVADRYLSRRGAVVLGAVTMALGHFIMAVPALLYPALLTIALGNGLFLPTLPSQIRGLYEPNDPRTTSAYGIYYIGVNVGAFLAPIGCGTLGEMYGWHWGFGAAGFGMLVGLLIYVKGRRFLPVDQREDRTIKAAPPTLDAWGRRQVFYLAGVALIAVVFRCAYEQVGNTVALWADIGVDRAVGELVVPMTWFMSINPFIVFLVTPGLLAMWSRRARQTGREVPYLRRMATGAFLVSASYLVLAFFDAVSGGQSPLVSVVVFMVLITLGELYILPVGLAMFGRLAPAGYEARMIAMWFLSAFGGNLAAGFVGTLWSTTDHSHFFGIIAVIAALAGVGFAVMESRKLFSMPIRSAEAPGT